MNETENLMGEVATFNLHLSLKAIGSHKNL
jgi:hypothetical protein